MNPSLSSDQTQYYSAPPLPSQPPLPQQLPISQLQPQSVPFPPLPPGFIPPPPLPTVTPPPPPPTEVQPPLPPSDSKTPAQHPPPEPAKQTPSQPAFSNPNPPSAAKPYKTPTITKKRPFGCRSIESYEILSQVGEGTYGQVFKARSNDDGSIVALKKIRMDNEHEGFPVTALREIKILRQLRHKNIINLKEIVTSKGNDFMTRGKGSVFMVFEYMDHDLAGLTDPESVSGSMNWFSLPQIKCYMQQLFTGLAYMHSNKILHRDVKGSNLLIDNHGNLKIADFGLARPLEDNRKYTNRVITLWYRPPEILLGADHYGPSIDMWSAGCLLAELLMRKPIFPGSGTLDQLDRIWRLCGSPSQENWPGHDKLPSWDVYQPKHRHMRVLDREFRDMDPAALDLVERLLVLDPKKRLTSKEAVGHDFFWTGELPCKPEELPKFSQSCHEFEAKKRRAEKRKLQQQQQQQQQQQRGNFNHPHHPQARGYNQGGRFNANNANNANAQGYQRRHPHPNQQQQQQHYPNTANRNNSAATSTQNTRSFNSYF